MLDMRTESIYSVLVIEQSLVTRFVSLLPPYTLLVIGKRLDSRGFYRETEHLPVLSTLRAPRELSSSSPGKPVF